MSLNNCPGEDTAQECGADGKCPDGSKCVSGVTPGKTQCCGMTGQFCKSTRMLPFFTKIKNAYQFKWTNSLDTTIYYKDVQTEAACFIPYSLNFKDFIDIKPFDFSKYENKPSKQCAKNSDCPTGRFCGAAVNFVDNKFVADASNNGNPQMFCYELPALPSHLAFDPDPKKAGLKLCHDHNQCSNDEICYTEKWKGKLRMDGGHPMNGLCLKAMICDAVDVFMNALRTNNGSCNTDADCKQIAEFGDAEYSALCKPLDDKNPTQKFCCFRLIKKDALITASPDVTPPKKEPIQKSVPAIAASPKPKIEKTEKIEFEKIPEEEVSSDWPYVGGFGFSALALCAIGGGVVWWWFNPAPTAKPEEEEVEDGTRIRRLSVVVNDGKQYLISRGIIPNIQTFVANNTHATDATSKVANIRDCFNACPATTQPTVNQETMEGRCRNTGFDCVRASNVAVSGQFYHANVIYFILNGRNVPVYMAEAPYLNVRGHMNTFLTLLFDQQIDLIFMLTKFVDGRVEKCSRYFSENVNQSMTFDNYIVTVTRLNMPDNFDVEERMLKITRRSDGATRTVHHILDPTWPDHRKHSDFNTVYQLLMIKINAARDGKKILVHCSAGIGRTGTFVASFGLLVALIEDPTHATMERVLTRVRAARAGAVQNYEQFISIAEFTIWLYFRIRDIPIGNEYYEFHTRFESLLAHDRRKREREHRERQ